MNLTVTVPGSTSNLGSGFDCLGIAIEPRLTIELVAGDGPQQYSGTLAGLSADRDIVAQILSEAGLLDEHTFFASSDIPLSRGLGSSGAAAVAAYALVARARTGACDADEVFARATALEGHPDNVAPSVYGGAIIATQRPLRIEVSSALALAFAVPDATVETATARKLLPESVPRTVAIRQAMRLGALTVGLREADPELVAEGMDDEIAVPYRKKLIHGYDAAVEAATGVGAFGATMSGSGSTVVAVCTRELANQVSAAMATALTNEGNPAVPLVSTISEQGFELS